MSVCQASSLIVADGRLHYHGPQGAEWRAPLEAILMLGELHAPTLEFGHYLAVVVDDSGAWLQSPAAASGVERALAVLSAHWRVPLALQLHMHRGAFASRVMWPMRFAGQAMFASHGGRFVLRAF
jgi:hypothetical protein